MARLSRNQLKTPVNLLQITQTRSATGAVNISKKVITTTFCELLPISSKDFITAQANGTVINAKMHFDYEIDIKTTDVIALLDGTKLEYAVIGIMPVPQDNKKIVLCKALQS